MDRHNTVLKLPNEHEEQREFVKNFRQAFKGVRIFAVPNGGHRNKIVAAKLKAEGVDSGVPDLVIPGWFLYVEMKRQKGATLSATQKGYKKYLEECGYKVLVCKGAADAFEKITTFYKKNRENIKNITRYLAGNLE